MKVKVKYYISAIVIILDWIIRKAYFITFTVLPAFLVVLSKT